MNLLLIFIVLNVLNVVLQTAKSIATVKCGKSIAAIANAVAYGLYTVVIIYTVCELPLWQKVLIVAGANFIGVYIVKAVEQKMQKEKLWKIEMAIPFTRQITIDTIYREITEMNIPCNYQALGDWTVFNCYCATKEQSTICKNICDFWQGKISAYESAPLI